MNALTPVFLAQFLMFQAEYDAGRQYLADQDYTDRSIHIQMVVRGLVATQNLIDGTLQVIKNEGNLLFAWQGTLALVQWEGSAT